MQTLRRVANDTVFKAACSQPEDFFPMIEAFLQRGVDSLMGIIGSILLITDGLEARFPDLERHELHPGEREMKRLIHRTAYAACTVRAPNDMDIRLRAMADDRMKLRLNGELAGLIDEGDTREFQFRARLRAGDRQLLVQCSQWIPHMWKEYSARPGLQPGHSGRPEPSRGRVDLPLMTAQRDGIACGDPVPLRFTCRF